MSGDGHKLRFKRLAENAGRLSSVNTRQCPAAQLAVNMNVARSQHFRAGLHRCQDDQVTLGRVDLLAGSHWLIDHPRRCWFGCRGVWSGGTAGFRGLG